MMRRNMIAKWVSTHRATGVETHGKRHNAVLLATDLSHRGKVNVPLVTTKER